MNRQFFLLISLLTTFGSSLSGQSNDNSKPWSISVSYSPRFEIRNPLVSERDVYWANIGISADHRLMKNFSYSFGFNYHSLDKMIETLITEGSQAHKIYYTYSFYDFPIRLNYHINDVSRKVNLYLKTSLINTFYHFTEEFQSLNENRTFDSSKYFIFGDIGVGSYFRIARNLTMTAQVSLGFGIKYQYPLYNYIESEIGIRYTLTK